MSRLGTIKAKLNELREQHRPPPPPRHGRLADAAKRHQYRLNPPLQERILRDFEREFNVSLPDDFAGFLTELGDGGAGPGNGLRSLDRIASLQRSYEQSPLAGTNCHKLSEAFPFSAADAQSIVDQRNQKPKSQRPPTLILPEDEVNTSGVMKICEYGCGYWGCLVVTGEQRGNIWDEEEEISFYPWGNDVSRMDFLSWYEAWLDKWLAPGAIEQRAMQFKHK